jgi:hypothetical protein
MDEAVAYGHLNEGAAGIRNIVAEARAVLPLQLAYPDVAEGPSGGQAVTARWAESDRATHSSGGLDHR